MQATEETSSLLAWISDERRKRQSDAHGLLGHLLDAADLFIHYIRNWLEQRSESVLPVSEAIADPNLSRSHSLFVLSNAALQGLFALTESYRSGIIYPSGWIDRKMLEARTNAGFIAYERTGLAGQRWILYSLYHLAKLEGDEESKRTLAAELRTKFPDDHPWRENRWAKTIDQDGTPKVLSNLVDRTRYVEMIWPTSSTFPEYMRRVRQENHVYELRMIRMDNLAVHPTVTGDRINPHPIRVLYSAIQMTWDILVAFSETDDLSLTIEMHCAHDRFVNTLVGVLIEASTAE